MSALFFDNCPVDPNGNLRDEQLVYRINGSSFSAGESINGMPSNAHLQEKLPNMMPNNSMLVNDPYLMTMNQKLSQISLQNSSSEGLECDLNGNNRSPPLFSHVVTIPSNSKMNEKNAFFDENNSDNHGSSSLPHILSNNAAWTTAFVMNNLRSKLNTIKQVQNDMQINYRDSQRNYMAFVANFRNQLNSILQETQNEIEQIFKNRIMEINYQRNQVEETLSRIEDKKQAILNGKSNSFYDEQNSFVNLFDPEFVNMVRNILECTAIPHFDFRIPNIDQAAIERAVRSLVVPLFKPPSNCTPEVTSSNLSSFMNIPSSNDDNDIIPFDNHHPPDNHFTMLNPSVQFQTWQTKPIVPSLTNMIPPGAGAEFNRNSLNPDNVNYFNNINEELASTSSSIYYGFNHHSQPGGNELTILNQKQAITKSLQPKVRRERISYYLKFGEPGTMEGQFAEPSGVAVNTNNDEIYIADANNHRVQVFDKWGKFKFHFGDGKLKFPNRVALSKITGDIVVSERPPVHQIQVYNKNGTFVCKFGAKHLRHPRGLAVDHKNRVVVVECKVMRVFIFNLQGVLLHSFDCSEQIQFPNAVAVSKKEEIFISDNRNHCVKVFNFTGDFLRQIGGQGITNYPIGVCLNEAADQLLVVDNYNNLNVTVFRLDGQLMGAYESSAKHQQCLDVALFEDHSIVVTSKDLQVYFYRLKDCYLNLVNNNGQQQPPTSQFHQRRATSSGQSTHKNGNNNNGQNNNSNNTAPISRVHLPHH